MGSLVGPLVGDHDACGLAERRREKGATGFYGGDGDERWPVARRFDGPPIVADVAADHTFP